MFFRLPEQKIMKQRQLDNFPMQWPAWLGDYITVLCIGVGDVKAKPDG